MHSLALVAVGAPAILVNPVNRTNYGGLGAVFSVTATGPPPFGYQWQLNGSNVTGATNSSLALSNLQLPRMPAVYTAAVFNGFGTNTSAGALLAVLTNAPTLLTQPTNRTVVAGSNVTLVVTATGPVPMTCQWQLNQGNISGATNFSLILSNIQTTNAGSYRALVGNPYASAFSSNAVLTVVDPLDLGFAVNATNLTWTTTGDAAWFGEITNSHDGVAAARGGVLTAGGQKSTLQTTVTGPGTLSFWMNVDSPNQLTVFDNGNILTSSLLTVIWRQSLFYIGEGDHLLQWQFTSFTSSPGARGVYLDQVGYLPGGTPASITAAPAAAQNLPGGSDVSFSVTAVGTPVLQYQWQFNNQDLPGMTNSSLALTDLQTTNTGNYKIIVNNNYGSTNLTVALTVNPGGPRIVGQPLNQSVLTGGSASLQVVAQGSNPLAYQWTFNNDPIPGATNPILNLVNVQSTNVGNYQVVVTNAVGSTNSAIATLTVGPSVIIVWVNNPSGIVNVPPGLTNVISLASGENNLMAVRSDGTIAVWGDNAYGQTNRLPVRQMSA